MEIIGNRRKNNLFHLFGCMSNSSVLSVQKFKIPFVRFPFELQARGAVPFCSVYYNDSKSAPKRNRKKELFLTQAFSLFALFCIHVRRSQCGFERVSLYLTQQCHQCLTYTLIIVKKSKKERKKQELFLDSSFFSLLYAWQELSMWI